MSNINLPEYHPFLNPGPDINALCTPLFNQFQINIFVHLRCYADGNFILLSNNSEWIRYHLAKGYLVPAPIPEKLLMKQESFNLIPNDGPFSEAKANLLQKFNTDIAVDFIKKYDDYYEMTCFAFPPSCSNAINIILNHLDVLKEFTENFKNRASQAIAQAEKQKIFLPESMRGIQIKQTNKLTLPLRSKFVFTYREYDCLRLTIRGKTAREAGEELGLSQRTIETYLNNIKSKMQVKTKSQLIEKGMKYLNIKF